MCCQIEAVFQFGCNARRKAMKKRDMRGDDIAIGRKMPLTQSTQIVKIRVCHKRGDDNRRIAHPIL